MHLNIPAKANSNTEKLVPYLYWCFIGIFGPELAIWAAWRQLMSARALKREIDEAKVASFFPCTFTTDLKVADSLQIFPHAWILCCHGRLRL